MVSGIDSEIDLGCVAPIFFHPDAMNLFLSFGETNATLACSNCPQQRKYRLV